MLIDFKPHLDRDTLLQHVVVESAVHAMEDVLDERYLADTTLDIALTVNGRELLIEEFCDHWQSQVEGMIQHKAQELLQERFTAVIADLHDRWFLASDTVRRT